MPCPSYSHRITRNPAFAYQNRTWKFLKSEYVLHKTVGTLTELLVSFEIVKACSSTTTGKLIQKTESIRYENKIALGGANIRESRKL